MSIGRTTSRSRALQCRAATAYTAALDGHIYCARTVRDDDFRHDNAVRTVGGDVHVETTLWCRAVDAEREGLAFPWCECQLRGNHPQLAKANALLCRVWSGCGRAGERSAAAHWRCAADGSGALLLLLRVHQRLAALAKFLDST